MKIKSDQVFSRVGEGGRELHNLIQSVTSIIQAFAVLTGVGFAIYELQLSGRAEQRAKTAATLQLIIDYNKEEVTEAFVTATAYQHSHKIDKFKKLATVEDVFQFANELSVKLAPWLAKVGSIDSCISTGICDEKLALSAFCEPIKRMQESSSKLESLYSIEIEDEEFRLDLSSGDYIFSRMSEKCEKFQ